MKKRGVALLMAAVFAVANLSGCGRNAGGDGTLGEKEKVRLMVWSPSEDQSKESGNGYRVLVRSLQRNIQNGILHLSMELQMRQLRRVRWHRIRKRVQMYLCMRTIHLRQ